MLCWTFIKPFNGIQSTHNPGCLCVNPQGLHWKHRGAMPRERTPRGGFYWTYQTPLIPSPYPFFHLVFPSLGLHSPALIYTIQSYCCMVHAGGLVLLRLRPQAMLPKLLERDENRGWTHSWLKHPKIQTSILNPIRKIDKDAIIISKIYNCSRTCHKPTTQVNLSQELNAKIFGTKPTEQYTMSYPDGRL